MAHKAFKPALLFTALLLTLAACGGGGGSSGASGTPSTATPVSTSTPTPAPTASATTCSVFCDDFTSAATDTLFTSAYKALPSDSSLPMYIKKTGTITVTGGALTLDGARLSIGAKASTDTTASTTPGGSFDLSRAYRISIDISAIGGTTSKAFQLYIDNNTTSSSASPLGGGSKVYSKTIAELAAGTLVIEPTLLGSTTSFITLRTESDAQITIDAIRIEYVDGSSSATPTPTSTSATPTPAPTTTTAPTALPTTPAPITTVSGGFATTTGGNVTGARAFNAATLEEINAIITAARTNDAGTKVNAGAYPVHITYTGNEDAKIAQIVADHTVDANGNCPVPHWNDAYREVSLKDFTAGITIEGANGSSANFGITIVNAGNVVIRNMKIGALAGANNDADMIRIDNSPNVWIDHNELFAVNNECNGSPDKDLTFESAIDIKKNATNITVSYNYIHDSKKVGLDGHTQSNGTTDFQRSITFHHNYYYNVNGRLPLQRGGWTHMYNNVYDKITGSGINVRAGGYALIEKNWFQNSLNPVTCRFDTVGCGYWDLRGNNLTGSADNTTYGITWDSAGTGGINADTWATTGAFPITLPYTYTAETPACVKANLAKVAGVGKNFAVLSCN